MAIVKQIFRLRHGQRTKQDTSNQINNMHHLVVQQFQKSFVKNFQTVFADVMLYIS